MGIETIIERRRTEALWDPELWDFVERVECVDRADLSDRGVLPRPLKHLEDCALQSRLDAIDRNIQYLDIADGPRDDLPPEEGWLSPWWWLRLRHWTLSEFARRGLEIRPTPAIPPPIPVHTDFKGIHAGAKPKLFRISRVPWLMPFLEEGKVRFASAAGYKAMENDESRADDEMTKGYRRAGGRVTITTIDGRPIEALGDVRFDTTRATPGDVPLPYWMLCASTDFDPRLIGAFPGGNDDDGVLAIFDPDEFKRRAGKALAAALPDVVGRIAIVDYYDVYHPPRSAISPVTMKSMEFANQRELRFVLDPGRGALIAENAYFLTVGSIADIAAIYGSDGRRIAGTGPTSFLA
ncbi:hypothetical protein AAG594_14215 [Citromicrobium bathyomarinum]